MRELIACIMYFICVVISACYAMHNGYNINNVGFWIPIFVVWVAYVCGLANHK